MKTIIRLTESDLVKIVKRVINEQDPPQTQGNVDPFEDYAYPTIIDLLNPEKPKAPEYSQTRYTVEYRPWTRQPHTSLITNKYYTDDVLGPPTTKTKGNVAGRVTFKKEQRVKFAPGQEIDVKPGNFVDFDYKLGNLYGYLYRNERELGTGGEFVGIKP